MGEYKKLGGVSTVQTVPAVLTSASAQSNREFDGETLRAAKEARSHCCLLGTFPESDGRVVDSGTVLALLKGRRSFHLWREWWKLRK